MQSYSWMHCLFYSSFHRGSLKRNAHNIAVTPAKSTLTFFLALHSQANEIERTQTEIRQSNST